MKNIVVYTAIIGDRDKKRDDIFCFTKNDMFSSNVMNAKIFKILSHQYIDADVSIWLDGNIALTVDPRVIVDEWLCDADMALWKHPWRDCIYDEAVAAKGLFEDESIKDRIDRQVEHYKKMGIVEHIGLGECNVIIRKHNDRTIDFNNRWWSEICRWSQRDQLSFPVALMESDIKVNFIEGNVRDHKYFIYTPH